MKEKIAQSKIINYLLLEYEVNDLAKKQKEISHLLSVKSIKLKAHKIGFIRAKKFLINKQKYIDHLNKIHPQIQYISGYQMRSHDSTKSFKVLVKDRKTKIRFYIGSSDLRKPDWNCKNLALINKSSIYPDDQSKWLPLRKIYLRNKYKKHLKHEKKVRPIVFRQCRLCGKTFESKWGALTCSEKCKRKWNNRMREKTKSSRTKKAKQNGKYDKTITLEKLYKRDHGICYLCGKKLNLDTPYNDPLAPTVEHVIPIIKGGTHTWNNVRLACRACNTAKGSKLSKEYVQKAS